MTQTKTETAPMIFDPWPDARPPGYVHAYPAARAPATWHLLSGAARGVIGGAVVSTLDAHRDRTRADQDWLSHRARERLAQQREDGHEGSHVAVNELDNNHHTLLLREAVALLLAGGTVRLTLRGYMANYEKAFERMAQLEPPR